MVDKEARNVCNNILNIYYCNKNICQSTYKRACKALDEISIYIQGKFNKFTNTTELVKCMSKYIKDFDVLELYHLDPNGKSFEAAKIINVSTCME